MNKPSGPFSEKAGMVGPGNKAQNSVFRGGVLLAAAVLVWVLAIGRWQDGASVQPSSERADPPVREAVLSPRLPLPPLEPLPEPQSAPTPAVSRREENGLKTKIRLTDEELSDFLRNHQRSAESLLAAYRISRDLALLEEALERYPDHPAVLLDWILRGNPSGEVRMEALLALEEADPENSLADYLIALEAFRSGDGKLAVAKLLNGWGKAGLENYALLHIDTLASAYQSAGYSPADALAEATYGLTSEWVTPLRELSDWIDGVRESYAAAGDAESAWMMSLIGARSGWEAGQHVGSMLMIDEILAVAIERRFLNTLDPLSDWVAGEQSVGERLAELQARTDAIAEVLPAATVIPTLDEARKLRYFEEVVVRGEVEALKRLLDER